MMENVVGTRIDSHLVTQVNKMTRNGGNAASKYVYVVVSLHWYLLT